MQEQWNTLAQAELRHTRTRTHRLTTIFQVHLSKPASLAGFQSPLIIMLSVLAGQAKTLLIPRIRINLILPETTVIALHCYITSLSLIVWFYLHSNFRGGLQKRMYFETECEMAVQGHPMSLILVPIESAYATSY